jgi:16S rRNA (cytidine1402-2'-O)-methyltransferase
LGTLYLIATPIGNLEDITLRALRVLGAAGTVAAEDTRTARRLLSHHGLAARLISYTEHNRRMRIPQILDMLQTEDVALVSEAGTPAISDPGQELVSAAIAAGFAVTSLPGASAVLTALTVSGLPTRQFLYLGFLPRQAGDRRALLRDVAAQPRTLVCFEAPSRLRASLHDILEVLGDRRIAVCRELTKLHEEVLRGQISRLISEHTEPRGEYTLAIEGATRVRPAEIDEAVRTRLRQLRQDGTSAREATTRLSSELGLPRRLLYEAWLELE